MTTDIPAITAFISEQLLNNRSVKQAENLLLSGLLDSMAVVRLMLFLEEHFHITIPPQDVTIANMASVEAISQYLSTRTAAPE
jgi:acyl carrier protein